MVQTTASKIVSETPSFFFFSFFFFSFVFFFFFFFSFFFFFFSFSFVFFFFFFSSSFYSPDTMTSDCYDITAHISTRVVGLGWLCMIKQGGATTDCVQCQY